MGAASQSWPPSLKAVILPPGRNRGRRFPQAPRSTVHALLALVLLAGITLASPLPAPAGAAPVAQTLTVSYADASDWLSDLPAEDRDDQIRDWAVLGLAGLLNLDTRTLRDALYDKTPVRDPLFYGLATARAGPGRMLPDGSGTLHLLAPADDPYLARTIGLLLDDYRKDAGVDPASVTLYRYRINPTARSVTLAPEATQPARAVREKYGYRKMNIDSLAAVQTFVAGAQHLSRLEVRDGQVWAGGWNWPGVPAGRVTAVDLTVIQRGYRNAAAGASPPGFSLDPGRATGITQTVALLSKPA